MYPVLVNRYYYSLADLADVEGPGPITNCHTVEELLRKIDQIWPSRAFMAYEQTMFDEYFWPEFYAAPVLFIDKEQVPWGAEVEPTAEDVEEAVLPLMGRIYRWYRESLERYGVLISAYTTLKTKFLDPVKVTSSGSTSHSISIVGGGTNTGTVSSSESHGSTTGTVEAKTRLESDTPQISVGSAAFASGYVSRAAQDNGNSSVTVAGSVTTTTTNDLANSTSSTDTGTTSNSGSVYDDRETPIERLNEIENKLRNLYADWANEFSKFVLHSAE